MLHYLYMRLSGPRALLKESLSLYGDWHFYCIHTVSGVPTALKRLTKTLYCEIYCGSSSENRCTAFWKQMSWSNSPKFGAVNEKLTCCTFCEVRDATWISWKSAHFLLDVCINSYLTWFEGWSETILQSHVNLVKFTILGCWKLSHGIPLFSKPLNLWLKFERMWTDSCSFSISVVYYVTFHYHATIIRRLAH